MTERESPSRAAFGTGSRLLVVGASAVVVAAGLRAASAAVVPALLGLFLAAVSLLLKILLENTPDLRWLAALLEGGPAARPGAVDTPGPGAEA